MQFRDEQAVTAFLLNQMTRFDYQKFFTAKIRQ